MFGVASGTRREIDVTRRRTRREGITDDERQALEVNAKRYECLTGSETQHVFPYSLETSRNS